MKNGRYRKSLSRYCKRNRRYRRPDYNRKALKGQSQVERTGQQDPFLSISIIIYEIFISNVITVKCSANFRGSRFTINFIDNYSIDSTVIVNKKGPRTMKINFEDVMTTQEASERYHRTAHTIKQACDSGRLTANECRKSGGVWLIAREGMERLYGKEQPKQAYYFAELQNAGSYRQAEKLKATSLRAAKREASMRQVSCEATLVLGTSINEGGVIVNPIARKEAGKHWEDVEVK